jgi:hypothetical protein
MNTAKLFRLDPANRLQISPATCFAGGSGLAES